MELFSTKRCKTSVLLFFTLSILNLLNKVDAYAGGADPAVCDTMIPGHGPAPQTSQSPYTVILSKNKILSRETLDITLTSPGETQEFRGFLIQVRKPGGEVAVGEFTDVPVGGLAKTLSCFDIARSAMTHTSRDLKKKITVQWTAPEEDDDDEDEQEYQVYYSVVGTNGGTFWTKVPHGEKIRVAKNEEDDDN